MYSILKKIDKKMKKAGISTRVDATGQAIGKRYARTDEIGIPFGVTIDFDTKEKGLVTLRECVSMRQVQLPLDDVVRVVRDLCHELTTWKEVSEKYPAFESSDK